MGAVVLAWLMVGAALAALIPLRNCQALRRVAAGVLLGGMVVLAGTVRLDYRGRPRGSVLESFQIRVLHGVIQEDVRGGAGQYRRVTLGLKSVETADGWRGSADGPVTVIWQGEDTVAAADRRLLPLRGDGLRVTLPSLRGTFMPGDPGESSVVFVQNSALFLEPSARHWARRREIRQAIHSRLVRLDPASRGLVLALLLGERSDLPQEMAVAVRRAGAAHVLALSGMHLGVLAAILYLAIRRMVPPRWAAVAALPILTVYVWVAGWIPSLVRALVLVYAAAVARFRRRQVPAPVLLGRTVVIIGMADPALILEVGFRLSVLALLGIMVAAPFITDILRRWMPPAVAGYFGVTMGAMMATMPLSMRLFGEVYPAGLLLAGVLSAVVTLQMWAALLFIAVARVPGVGTVVARVVEAGTVILEYTALPGETIPPLRGNGAVHAVAGAVCGLFLLQVVCGIVAQRHQRHELNELQSQLHF